MRHRDLLPRLAASHLARALDVMPVVVLTGARQTGKSTLAGMLAAGDEWSYATLDVPELSAIENVPAFDTILRSVALRVGTIVNQTQLAREASIPQSTVNRYVAILETSYQLHRLPAYTVSRTKQLVKSPKYYWVDVGLALFLAGEREPRGQHLENLIVQDLLAWRDARTGPADVMYWRTSKGYEVDIVIDHGDRVLPVEIKATTHPSTRDVASLRVFLDEYGDRADAGLLLHTGDRTFWIASNVLAALGPGFEDGIGAGVSLAPGAWEAARASGAMAWSGAAAAGT